MRQTIEFIVTEPFAGVRIDKYLTSVADGFSRSRIQALIQESAVTRNGALCAKPREEVAPGDCITLSAPPPAPSTVEPEPLPLDIVYQDSDIAVINKAWGMSVHPTDHNKSGTLVNALLHHLNDLSGIGGVLRPGIVHRLDRVTSGVIIVAKHDEAHRRLSASFKARETKKAYWAIVHGRPGKDAGEIEQPIGRHPTDRKRMTIRQDGRPSLTRYRFCGEGLGASWLELYPVTGRTHQIRVHLKHIGHPIAGDLVYTLKKYSGRGELERAFADQTMIALHARSIRFPHPGSGEEVEFKAPPPDALHSILERMK
ncbi:MAG: RluA family pseudouridine synthase [Candidatus Hinthialibacter antarcticus]|nr:RluA family pseudouridine synthase [Candidatus Hinthialibacter antarcticus]